jgi:hypothetical protein
MLETTRTVLLIGSAFARDDAILSSVRRQPVSDRPRDARALLVNVSCVHIARQIVRNQLEVNGPGRLIASVEDRYFSRRVRGRFAQGHFFPRRSARRRRSSRWLIRPG